MIIKNAKINLDDFSLHIEHLDLNSPITLVSGQNGVGKSTFLKSILGLHSIEPKLDNKKFEFGYVPQDYRKTLLPWLSAKDNLLLFNSSNILLEKLFASGFNESDLLKKPRMLSGGQCQRIALIRELSMNIDYLILDEPFSGLDKSTIPKISKIFKNFIDSGKKIIMTSHIHLPDEICSINGFQEIYIERTNENLATLKLKKI